jgi:DNA-binding CsgD family transcriptional regulator
MSADNTIHIVIKSFLLRNSIISLLSDEYESNILIHQISESNQLMEHFKNNRGIFIVDQDLLGILPAGYSIPHFIDIICIAIQKENPRFKGWVKDWIYLNDTKQEIIIKLNNTINPCQPEQQVENNLSDREKDVIRLVAKGLTNKEIAEMLHLSIHTVITHRKNITGKLGIKTISGLSIYAFLNGIIQSEEANI